MDAPVQLVGRSSSHFTRVAAIVAHELGVPFELVPVYDLASLDAASYGDHPALKLPTLRLGERRVFGTENICRTIATLAAPGPRLVWPEHATGPATRNAQELVWHAMAAQVQLVLATGLGGLPLDNPFLTKVATGFLGALAWLDAHLDEALDELPAPRDTSLLEVTMFCLVEHLAFRRTVSTEPYARLRELAATFATRSSARRTPYRYDAP